MKKYLWAIMISFVVMLGITACGESQKEIAEKAAVEKLAKRFQLTKDEGERVLRQYVAGQDLSTWGLVNAVTEAAKESESIQRRVELQTIGGRMLPESRMPMLPMAA